jgi:hypothetical protein
LKVSNTKATDSDKKIEKVLAKPKKTKEEMIADR